MHRMLWTAIAAIGLSSGTVQALAADASLDRVAVARTLSVGVAVNAPWVIKLPNGKLTGYDIDLADRLARDLGVTPRYVEMPFADLVPRLAKGGGVDIVAAGLAITPERARQVVFSEPTGVQVVRTVAARDAKPLGAGSTIAVLAGSTDEAAARAAFPRARVTPYPSEHDAVAALVDGRAQAMVATSPVPRLATRLFDGRLRLVGRPLARTAEAFALRPDDMRLKAYVDNWIDARRTDGTLAKLRGYWFFNFRWVGDLEPAKAPAAVRR